VELENNAPRGALTDIKAAAELRRQHAEIESLRAQLDHEKRTCGAGSGCCYQASKIEMLEQQLAQRLPDGYVLVPVEPTAAMVTAYLAANKAYWWEVDQLPKHPTKWVNGTPSDATVAGYKAMLAAAPQPHPSQEPVAWHYTVNGKVHIETRQLDHYHVVRGEYVKGRPLVFAYESAQQASKPMTGEQAYAGYNASDLRSAQTEDWFNEGVRFAERFHKIGEKQ
jgi:hypothetical protein